MYYSKESTNASYTPSEKKNIMAKKKIEKVDEVVETVEETVEVTESTEHKRVRETIELYKIQNPEKYEARKEELTAYLEGIK